MTERKLKKGDRVARLTILKIFPPRYYAVAKVKCKCGTVKEVKLINIIAGRTKSCGCLRREAFRRFLKKRSGAARNQRRFIRAVK